MHQSCFPKKAQEAIQMAPDPPQHSSQHLPPPALFRQLWVIRRGLEGNPRALLSVISYHRTPNEDLMLLDKYLLPCSLLADIRYQEFWLLSLCYWKITFISPPSCNPLRLTYKNLCTWFWALWDLLNIIEEDKPKFIHL